MSFTQSDHVFGGFSETGIMTLLMAISSARPRYVNYATPGLAPSDTVDVTQIAPGPFGLNYAVAFSLASVNITPDTTGSPLPPGNNQLTIGLTAKLTVVGATGPVSSSIAVYVECQPTVSAGTAGGKLVGISLVTVKITGVQPAALETLLEALLTTFLQQTLNGLKISFGAFTLPPITLLVQDGPTAESERLDVRGDIQ